MAPKIYRDLSALVAAAEDRKSFAIYLIAILMYTVASPGPDSDNDPNPRGGGQLPNP